MPSAKSQHQNDKRKLPVLPMSYQILNRARGKNFMLTCTAANVVSKSKILKKTRTQLLSIKNEEAYYDVASSSENNRRKRINWWWIVNQRLKNDSMLGFTNNMQDIHKYFKRDWPFISHHSPV